MATGPMMLAEPLLPDSAMLALHGEAVEAKRGRDRGVAGTADLIAAIYEAALLPERWRGLPGTIAVMLGAVSARLTLTNSIGALAAGIAVLAVPVSEGRTLVLTVSGFRDDHASRAAQTLLARIGQHLGRAFAIAEHQARRCLETAVALLASIGAGAAFLDAQGRVLAANPLFAPRVGAAEQVVGTALRLDQGRNLPPMRAALDRAGAGADAAVPLHDAEGTCRAALHLMPFAGEDLCGAVAIAFVATPESPIAPPCDRIRALLGLTPAEAQVAQAIAAGRSVEQIARSGMTAVETVRSHLKRVFCKTGTGRQIELARLVLGLGPPGD